ncbi:MAG: hypothetical protein RLZZ227_2888 [Pseudomonadota bacterium]|jgi:protein required for attachment to host cells
MQKRISYILAADSGGAKLYSAQGGKGELALVQQIDNPAGRKMRSELDADRPGQQRNDGGGMHGLGGDRDSQQHESERFARLLCRLLHEEYLAGKFSDLMIAAPPHFLGELRQHMSADCYKVLGRSVNKDLLRSDAQDILQHFDQDRGAC